MQVHSLPTSRPRNLRSDPTVTNETLGTCTRPSEVIGSLTGVTETTTWKIPQLIDWVNAVVANSLGGEVWVEGEISNLQRSAAGHVYFTLIERDLDERQRSPHTLAVTLFEWHRVNVNRHLKRSGGSVRMGDGVRVRIRGTVEVYSARSQLQLRMSGIDPVFTLGSLAADRARLLAALQDEGLLEAQQRLETPPLPLRVVIITSIGSAAHADALDELRQSGFGFDLTTIDARVQGADAPESIVTAIERGELLDPDLILIARGGGARTDLVAFDDERVARAIATCPIPVWVGLGHETDRTVADEVAQRSFKTPTACAAGVIDTVRDAARALDGTFEQILDAVGSALQRGETRLRLASAQVSTSTGTDLRRADRRLLSAAISITRLAEGSIRTSSERVERSAGLVTRTAPQRLAERVVQLDAIEAVLRAYDPSAAMARGWSITRTATGALATAANIAVGDRLFITLHDAALTATVDSLEGNET